MTKISDNNSFDKCYDCPFLCRELVNFEQNYFQYSCGKNGNVLEDINIIPDTCPLPE